jgi:hypothetical protein
MGFNPLRFTRAHKIFEKEALLKEIFASFEWQNRENQMKKYKYERCIWMSNYYETKFFLSFLCKSISMEAESIKDCKSVFPNNFHSYGLSLVYVLCSSFSLK